MNQSELEAKRRNACQARENMHPVPTARKPSWVKPRLFILLHLRDRFDWVESVATFLTDFGAYQTQKESKKCGTFGSQSQTAVQVNPSGPPLGSGKVVA